MLDVPSQNIADVLAELRPAVIACLASIGVRLNNPEELVYQPILPASDESSAVILYVSLLRPISGKLIAIWCAESQRALFYAQEINMYVGAGSRGLPVSIGPPAHTAVQVGRPTSLTSPTTHNWTQTPADTDPPSQAFEARPNSVDEATLMTPTMPSGHSEVREGLRHMLAASHAAARQSRERSDYGKPLRTIDLESYNTTNEE